MRFRVAIILVPLLAFALSSRALAQSVQNIVLQNSFSPIGAGARGVGMGGAFIAVADDGTAATFNPAGLAQLRTSEVAAVGFSSSLGSLLFGGRIAPERTTDHGALDFLGVAVPVTVAERHLTVQISYQRSVDLFGQGRGLFGVTELSRAELGLDGDGDVTTLVDVDARQSGALHSISLSAGYQLTSRLAVGMTLNRRIGEWGARGTRVVRLLEDGARPIGPDEELERGLDRFETTFDQQQSLRALSLDTGFLLKYRYVSVGGVLKLPFSGDYDVDDRSSTVFIEQDVAGASQDADLNVTSQLHWPRSAGIGIALRPLTGLTLSVDYRHTSWARTYIESLPDGALLTPLSAADDPEFTDRNFFDLAPRTLTATDNTDQWRLGGEYLLVFDRLVVPVRAGMFRDRSPLARPGRRSGRQIRGLTAGGGLNFSRFVFDVAYERRASEGEIGLGGQAATTTTIETVVEDRVVGSFIYRFGADDPIREFFRRIFARDER